MKKLKFLIQGFLERFKSYQQELLTLSFVVLGVGLVGVISATDTSTIQASLFYEGTEVNFSQDIKQGIKKKDLNLLQKILGEGEEQGSFLTELFIFSTITDISVEKWEEYYFISFFAGKRDSMHPYHAVFSQKNGFFWNENFTGQIVKEEKIGVLRIFTVKNTSVYPWVINNYWIENFSGKKIALQPLEDDNEEIVFPGETVKIMGNISGFPVPENKDYGFTLVLGR